MTYLHMDAARDACSVKEATGFTFTHRRGRGGRRVLDAEGLPRVLVASRVRDPQQDVLRAGVPHVVSADAALRRRRLQRRQQHVSGPRRLAGQTRDDIPDSEDTPPPRIGGRSQRALKIVFRVVIKRPNLRTKQNGGRPRETIFWILMVRLLPPPNGAVRNANVQDFTSDAQDAARRLLQLLREDPGPGLRPRRCCTSPRGVSGVHAECVTSADPGFGWDIDPS